MNLLKFANLHEKLPKPKYVMATISFVNDLKPSIDFTLFFDEKVDHHLSIS